jgi:hypothetical protein
MLGRLRQIGHWADGTDDSASACDGATAEVAASVPSYPVFDPPSDASGWTPPPDIVPPVTANPVAAAAQATTASTGAGAAVLTGDGADLAMHANIARATYGVDGTGLRIGIISDSFNYRGGEAADQADGNLPTGSNMVVVDESLDGGNDEGRAMAELVHRIAPGAQIYFASDQDSDDGTADAITTLAADGCNVIVDDISLYDDPFFEPGGEVPQAIQDVVAQGVDYFTSAGNNGNDYYYSTWTPMPAGFDLPGVGIVPVQDVGGGQPYEFVDIGSYDNAILDIQWDQPFNGIGTYSADTPYVLGVAVYDRQHNFLYALTFPQDPEPYFPFDIDNTTSTRGLYLAFFVSNGTVTPGAFKAMFINEDGVAEFAGPGAGTGSGGTAGHAMEAGVNSVGAIDYTDTPEFGTATPANEYFSSYSGSQYLFDANGNRLATPEPAPGVTFSAPDGVDTDVFGDFYGTSAAAPDAAAVALLVLQEDPRLSTVQVTYVLASTALATSTPDQGGAGLVQADEAVGLAHTAITTPIWTGQGGSTAWETAANWSDDAVPGSGDTVTLSDGLGLFNAAYTVAYSTPLSAIAALVVSGGDNGVKPLLSIEAGDDLVAGTVRLGTGDITISGALIITGSLVPGGGAAPHISIDAGGILDIGGNDQYVGITFLGAGSLLFDSQTPTISGPITGFSSADIIDLTGLAYNPTNRIVIDGSTVSIETSDGTTLISFTLNGDFSGLDLATDGRAGGGGTVIFATPPITAAVMPVIVAPAWVTLNAGLSHAIGGVNIFEDGATAGENFTVLLADTNGRLSADGTGVSGSGTTHLMITGSLAQVNADLSTLTDIDGTTPSDTIQISAADTLGNGAVARQIAVAVNGVLTLAAPASATVGLGNTSAIAGVSLSESGNVFGDDFSVTVADSNGDLSASGTGVSGYGTSLTITGSLSQVNADLATLTDTAQNSPATTPADLITVTASNSSGASTQAQIQVNVTGLAEGTTGAVGATGQPGGAGQSVTAQAADPASGNNQALAVGGNGGDGGAGANGAINPKTGLYAGPGGPAGAGGAGGSAAATAVTTIADATDSTLAQATADGGAGGGGGLPGQGRTTGRGGSGGPGGQASASATGTNATGSVEADALTTGGNGGGASGTGGVGGQGGVASGTSASAHALADATADAEQTGGDGGSGVQGAAGADGAASALVNAVSGETHGGTLNLYQNAYGGNGGDSDTSVAGAGGAAASSLALDDTGNSTQSLDLTGSVGAYGGSAGIGAAFSAQGGAATATEVLTGAGDGVEALGQSFGGVGGGGAAGKGGAANTSITSIQHDDGGSSSAIAQSYGGSGGFSQTGNGGAGGASIGAVAVAKGGDYAYALALGQGGTGGSALSASQNSGAGGVASGTTSFAQATTSAAATATQTGGDGGTGLVRGKGANGAGSSLVNAVSGETDGGTLTLEQDAVGGDGGASTASFAGSGGAASSSLTFDDTKNTTESAALFGTATATGGNAGMGTLFSPAGGSATVRLRLTGAGSVTAVGVATGGNGGNGAQSSGGAGGATVSAVAGGDASASATALGGTSATNANDDGVGGAAANPAVATATGQIATATATGTGGTGGVGFGSGQWAGSGGVASGTSATATGLSAATASAKQVGGQGGAGSTGAAGGAGGLSKLVNAVSGSTDDGALVLDEVAQGGNGGASDTGLGGAGGFATLGLTFDDTKNATQSASILATVTGIGGAGGNSSGAGGNGGGVLDSATITGTGNVTLDVTADGGNAGSGGAAGGAASATSTATGAEANTTATADGGIGKTIGGLAQASATATGGSGTVIAEAQTGLAPGSLIVSAAGYAAASFAGSANAASVASIGSSPVFVINRSAVSVVSAAPLAAAVASNLAAQPGITAALGAGATSFAIGELGGGHSSTGTAAQTSTATADVTLDTLLLSAHQDLILSLFRPIWSGGSSMTGIDFSLTANGTTLVNEDFFSAAAAGNWFNDHAINLGPLASAASVDLHLALSVTTTNAGGSFDAGFLLDGKQV